MCGGWGGGFGAYALDVSGAPRRVIVSSAGGSGGAVNVASGHRYPERVSRSPAPQPPAEPPEDTAGGPAEAAPARRSARVVFCTAVLSLEAFVVLFATLVGFGLRLVEPRSLMWAFGGAGVLICVIAAGLVSRRAGMVVGSVVQVGLIAAGLVIPMMFVIGITFAIIWVVALLLGAKIDTERAQRAAAEAAAGNDPAS